MPKNVVAERAFERVRDIDYPNFKASVEEDDRHGVYTAVWRTLLALQHRTIGMFRSFVPATLEQPTLGLEYEDEDLPF